MQDRDSLFLVTGFTLGAALTYVLIQMTQTADVQLEDCSSRLSACQTALQYEQYFNEQLQTMLFDEQDDSDLDPQLPGLSFEVEGFGT